MESGPDSPPILEAVFSAAADAVRNAIVLEPAMPSAELAEHLYAEADSALIHGLGRALIVAHLAKLIRSERAKELHAKHAQLALPGFEHLPLRIPVSAQRRVPLRDANYTQIRIYYRALRRKYRDRGRKDPKLKEAKQLMERMRRRSRKHRGITVAAVFGADNSRLFEDGHEPQ
jgi:hypothetical protein